MESLQAQKALAWSRSIFSDGALIRALAMAPISAASSMPKGPTVNGKEHHSRWLAWLCSIVGGAVTSEGTAAAQTRSHRMHNIERHLHRQDVRVHDAWCVEECA